MKAAKIRGVNLGGWLVLERWMTPSIFSGTKATDEYSLCQELGATAAKERLSRHRDSFVTENHMAEIAKLGLNTVRLPVGYWLFGSEEPYIAGTDNYVDQLFNWADKHGLKVILDFHAAPGSQNGWDHSGHAGDIGWPTDENVARSLEFIRKLAGDYGHEPSLYGIEVLNEPHWGIPLNTLIDYYRKAGQIIKAECGQGTETIVSDAFRPREMADALDESGLSGLILDVHLYQLYTPEDRSLDLGGHLHKTKTEWQSLLGDLAQQRQVMVGEWSAAMHELYQKIDQPNWHYTSDDYQKYFMAQRQVFESQNSGWVYWTARTEDRRVWSLLNQPHLLG